MSEFTLLEQALENYEKTKVPKTSSRARKKGKNKTEQTETISSKDTNETDKTCPHNNVIIEKGIGVCIDCGEEIEQQMNHEKNYRCYGQELKITDQSAIQNRKIEERNIFKDVENLGFSESIISQANKIYAQVTQGKIFRGKSRKAIVFACIFHAYKIGGKPQSHERLIQIFNLNRKTGLKGLKYVNLHAPKDSKLRTTYITPVNLVEEIMEKFSATNEQKQEVIDLYKSIKNKSTKLNRSRPQSVASGLVYYWICMKGKNITIKEFAKKVILSELTISKIAKEISEILETPEIL